jgi:hypothetical protein
MMDIEQTRTFIRTALTEYAGFFRAIAQADASAASEGLARMESVDSDAKFHLRGEAWEYYRTRKARLLGLFRKRLMMALESDVERELVTQAERLIDRLEVSRVER